MQHVLGAFPGSSTVFCDGGPGQYPVALGEASVLSGRKDVH